MKAEARLCCIFLFLHWNGKAGTAITPRSLSSSDVENASITSFDLFITMLAIYISVVSATNTNNTSTLFYRQ